MQQHHLNSMKCAKSHCLSPVIIPYSNPLQSHTLSCKFVKNGKPKNSMDLPSSSLQIVNTDETIQKVPVGEVNSEKQPRNQSQKIAKANM